jgi:SAM-dependent methyltransferase
MTTTNTLIDTYQSLTQIVAACENHISEETKTDMEILFDACQEDLETDSHKMLTVLILHALQQRNRSNRQDEHIYLKQYDIPQIQLFNILIERFPFVTISQQITNNAIVQAMKPLRTATLIDIGIGQGTQVVHILQQASELTLMEKLVIVGIEPFKDALDIAAARIADISKHLPFDVEFVAIHDFAERVDFKTIEAISGEVIVNASLALHHIPTEIQRLETLARIKQLNPVACILIEPNVDHMEPQLITRFKNCYNHYYSVFAVIDQIEASTDEKNALKLFFGREIQDVLGKSEADRFERHEPAASWIQKLESQQFSIHPEYLLSPVKYTSGVYIDEHQEGYIGFTHENETVLSIIYAN